MITGAARFIHTRLHKLFNFCSRVFFGKMTNFASASYPRYVTTKKLNGLEKS